MEPLDLGTLLIMRRGMVLGSTLACTLLVRSAGDPAADGH